MNTERDLRNQLDYAISEGLAKGMAQGMEKGLAQGMTQGMTQGEANARAAIAKTMKAKGLSPATISEYTGLSIEEIARL